MSVMNRQRLTTPCPLPVDLWTIAEAAELLRRSERSVYRLLRAGVLRPVRIGGRTLVTAAELRRLVERSQRPAPSRRAS
jgi:excisionase family DNA binding protein